MDLREQLRLKRAPHTTPDAPVGRATPGQRRNAAGEQLFGPVVQARRLAAGALRLCLLLLGTAAVLGVVGCGVTEEVPMGSAAAHEVPGRVIQGNVHGGVYPITNALITLMQTQTSSPGSYGATAKALLTANSDKNGYFTFPDSGWTCTSTEYVYIVVTQGHSINITSSNAVNNHVVQVGVIGPCSALDTPNGTLNQASVDAVNVFVSELSTVAAASALGNFISVTDPNDETGDQVVNIGAPANNASTGKCSNPNGGTTTCTAAGLAHAFTNAVTLVDSVRTNNTFPSGMANTGVPNTVSSIPSALINSIANILQQCVDSTDNVASPASNSTPSAPCSSLFAAAKSPAGFTPVDTLEVALEMAKYPTNNIGGTAANPGLFGQTAPNVPFTPYLASAPTSFAVSIFYGVTDTGSNTPFPIDLALDANDDAYVLYTNLNGSNPAFSAVNEWTASGVMGLTGTRNTTYTRPVGIAIDASNAVYVTNNDMGATANSVLLGLSGTSLYPLSSVLGASGLAIDNRNNVFVSSTAFNSASVSEYSQASLNAALNASVIANPSGTTNYANPNVTATAKSSTTTGAVSGLALDSVGNVWGAGVSGGNAGVFLWPKGSSTTAPYAAGGGSMTAFNGKQNSFSVALNSKGVAYFPLNNDLAQATYFSSTLNTNAALASTGAASPHRSEVDGAGNVFWTDLENSGLLWEYIPGSTPTTIAMLPCFPYPTTSGLVCLTTAGGNTNYTPSNLRAMGIDSAGDVWYTADAGYGAVIETLGLAAPTWPLMSYGTPGTMPK